MILRPQTSTTTNETMGGYTHTLRHSFLFRVVWIMLSMVALAAVTICTYQGTENVIAWVGTI